MDLADFTGKPCQSKMAYEFIPKKKVLIDLHTAAAEVTSIATIEMTTKVLLMLKLEHCTISLFPSGKLLVRGERDETKAHLLAKKLVSLLKESVK